MQWEFLKGAREYVLWLPAATQENGYLGEERSVICVWFGVGFFHLQYVLCPI